MNDDPEMARIYQEAYSEIKHDREKEYTEILRIKGKYDYIFDENAMTDKKISDRYTLDPDPQDIEEEMMSTELSDPEYDLIYKRYKMAHYEHKVSVEEIEEEARDLKINFFLGKAYFNGKHIRK